MHSSKRRYIKLVLGIADEAKENFYYSNENFCGGTVEHWQLNVNSFTTLWAHISSIIFKWLHCSTDFRTWRSVKDANVIQKRRIQVWKFANLLGDTHCFLLEWKIQLKAKVPVTNLNNRDESWVIHCRNPQPIS